MLTPHTGAIHELGGRVEAKTGGAGIEHSEIAREQIELQKLVTALDLVIGSFDPDYQVAPAVRAAGKTPPRNSKRLSDEAKTAIDGVNKRQTVLEVYPKGPLVYEWTRRIAEPDVSVDGVMAANMLLTGVLEYCLVVGIEALIVETHPKRVNLLVSTGWDAMPFAAPSTLPSGLIVPICAKPLPSVATISHEQRGINGSVLEYPEDGTNSLTGRPLRPFLQRHKQSSEVSEYA